MNTETKATRKWLVLVCACAVGMAGCFTKRPASARLNMIRFEHPVMPAMTEAELGPPPVMPFEAVAAPTQLVTIHGLPARPRVAPAPAAGPAAAEKSAEPTIAPELTTEESQAAKSDTQRNLDLVEKHLTVAWGRKLNTSQQDLVSKIHGFSDNAREAMRAGDWVRARNLSKKAVVLSEQLAASL
jgi:hypothetical protein